jgi:S-DNA-T family DNA segregation ATPase FtsK/SpoIIIE
VAKRKAEVSKARKSEKTASSAAAGTAPRLRWQVGGGFLVLAALWMFLALVLGIARPADHPLGPYLGRATGEFLAWFLGAMPGLVLPFALVATGVRLVAGPHAKFGRAVPASWLAWGHLFLFFCLPSLGEPAPAAGEEFQTLSRRAGAVGQFLTQSLLQPLFGAHWIGPALILCATLLASVLYVAGITPRTFLAFLARLSAHGLGKVKEKVDERRAGAIERESREPLRAPSASPRRKDIEALAEKELLAGGALALGVEPKGRFMDRRIRPEPEEGVLPLDPRTPAPQARAGKTPLVAGAVIAGAAAAGAEMGLDGKALEVVRKMSALRPPTAEDLAGLDPLEVREIKRRYEEMRRAAQLNEWEDRSVQAQVSRRPRIETQETEEAPEPEPKPAKPGRRIARPEPEEVAGSEDGSTVLGPVQDPPEEPQEAVSAPVVRKRAPAPPKVSQRQAVEEAAGRYKVPDPASILPDPPAAESEIDEAELQATAERLVLQLRNFNVQGKVLQIEPGPVITRFKVELAPGTPVRKISNLSEDLALALRARRIRIQAPIPGESLVGVEIPNAKPETVHIKELLRAPQFRDQRLKLPVVLGKDTAGHPAFTDLSRAPHLLIAGQTGSGKSVCINTILSSLLFSQSPERLRMILIDPKVVELSTYAEIPHLMAPVVTKPEEAVQALKWTAVEMDRRYEVLAAAGVRNIAGFNEKMEAGTLPEAVPEEDRGRMAYLLVIVDEFADLMMVAGKEVETNVARIAQKARAVGIHMILATQRPSTNVITGVIKANLPTRIAFQVASQIDARTIMEHQGAEDLLGRGDMLFRGIENPEPVRVHGAFVTDGDAEAAALAASSQGVKFPMVESFDTGEGEGDDEDDDGAAPVKLDSKFGEAARLVALSRQGSVSMLQRRMEIGFARAGRLMDQLERMGVVGKDRGSKAREVLMDELQIEDLVRRLEEGY